MAVLGLGADDGPEEVNLVETAGPRCDGSPTTPRVRVGRASMSNTALIVAGEQGCRGIASYSKKIRLLTTPAKTVPWPGGATSESGPAAW